MKKTAVDHLANKRYRSVVIRLLVDPCGQVQQGEVVNLNSQSIGYFRLLAELPPLLAAWLTGQACEEETTAHDQ